ncbi:MAG: acetate--CoA ligase family protein [Rhodobacteraceae bacterium]|nr:acetate--CoA ligase family protein [Paracoccaceae bacterium]
MIDRPLHTPEQLRCLVQPDSIAVVGASPTPGSFGKRTLENLAGFDGKVCAVNPKHQEIDGVSCYPSLDAIPQVPDCVILCVASDAVVPMVQTCADLGVGGVVIYASGFAEMPGEEGALAQARLAEISRNTGLRIAGPNCAGLLNFGTGALMHFIGGLAPGDMVRGPIGMVSQSGGIGYGILQAMDRGIGFSHFFAVGNSCDVDACDLMNYMLDDPETSVIVTFLEGLESGSRMRELGLRALAKNKPIVICKTGQSDKSHAVIRSHTGAVVGSIEAYQTLFEETGLIQVDSLEGMPEIAQFLSKSPAPGAGGLGVMTTSGGLAVMAVDKADSAGVDLPQLSEQSQSALRALVPSFGTVSNPLDITAAAQRDPALFRDCVATLCNEPGFSVLLIAVPYAQNIVAEQRAHLICEAARTSPIPVVVAWMNEALDCPAARIYENDENVSLFRSMTRAMEAIHAWKWRDALRIKRLEGPAPRLSRPEAFDVVRPVLKDAARDNRALNERESKLVLQEYGVRTTQDQFAADRAQAILAAKAIGFPVVLKVESADILHKTDAGLVVLDLKTSEDVGEAFDLVTTLARKQFPDANVQGVVIQEMVAPGTEIIVGAKYEPGLGQVLMFGLGGVYVELLKDVAFALTPVAPDQVLAKLTELKGAALLRGYRGSPAVDLDVLADQIARISEFVADADDLMAELDVNPILVRGDSAVAVDAVIVPQIAANEHSKDKPHA